MFVFNAETLKWEQAHGRWVAEPARMAQKVIDRQRAEDAEAVAETLAERRRREAERAAGSQAFEALQRANPTVRTLGVESAIIQERLKNADKQHRGQSAPQEPSEPFVDEMDICP